MMGKKRDKLFMIAALFNLIVGVTLLAAPGQFFDLIQMEALSTSFLFERFAGLLVCGFGVGYWKISADPSGERSWIEVGGFAKIGVVLLFTSYVVIMPEILNLYLITLGDLVFALFFWQKYRTL